ncbi:uncharacterized protein LOC123662715 [Melitaea cinxia]|uniref:uncharacterized protein LOC123662715 n=1 Tax=Melitaea cinxia TaxID=113334 RepID=UPI001E272911|nr:uncharacterized protein LOC123662715 [Melitaea cinxia]
MILNASKCAHIKFTRKKNIVHSKYFIQNQQLEEVSVIRDLGIILDSRLTFKDHIDYIASKAWKLLGFIRRNTADFKRTDCITRIYNALVRSILEYAVSAWNPHYRAHVNRLERVQRSFTRYLAFKDNTSPYRANYAARLKHFKLHPLEKRRQNPTTTIGAVAHQTLSPSGRRSSLYSVGVVLLVVRICRLQATKIDESEHKSDEMESANQLLNTPIITRRNIRTPKKSETDNTETTDTKIVKTRQNT